MSSRSSFQQYRTRNSLYLRISRDCVLAMVLYLDPTHIGWMNDHVLQRVLETLRDRIRLKLLKEKGQKKSVVDVYRGAGWQMAYYFRRTAHKHAVLLKDKQIVMEEPEKPKPSTSKQPYDMDIEIDDEDDEGVRTSMPPPQIDPLLDEDEEKTLKPKLKVSYAGFAIFGRTLVVVVEPYPPLTEQQIRETSMAPSASEVRELSAYPPTRSRASSSMAPPLSEAQQPLFRSETPASQIDESEEQFRARSQSVARTFAISDDEDDEEEAPRARGSESLISRLGENERDVGEAPKDLSIKQYLSPAPDQG